MIDEKKISKAAKEYAVDTWNHEEEQFSCVDGFEAGANWALQEFKKSLWHDASEEPKGNSECIINTRLGYYKRCWNAIDKCWDDEEGYDHFCEMFEVKRWMYLNDILPKEGGEQ